MAATEVDSSVTIKPPITNAVSPNRRKSRPSSTEVKEQDLIKNGSSSGGGNGTNTSNSNKPKIAPPPPPPRSSSTKANSSEPENDNDTNSQASSTTSTTEGLESDYVEVGSELSSLKKGPPPPVAAKPVNVDIKSLTAKARQDALEQRHQELLSRQKALQEQYQRLQNMQGKTGKNPSASGGSGLTNGQYSILNNLESPELTF